MSTRQDDRDSGEPTRLIHQRYRQSLEARRAYRDAQQFGQEFREAAHRDLQSATSDYFEAARPHLTSSTAVEDYWEGSEEHYLDRGSVQVLEHDGKTTRIERLPDHVVEGNEDLIETMSVFYGLRALDGEFDGYQQQVVSWSDATGTHQRVDESARLIRPPLLMRASRLLDQALEALDLLAEVDEPLPKGRLEDQS